MDQLKVKLTNLSEALEDYKQLRGNSGVLALAARVITCADAVVEHYRNEYSYTTEKSDEENRCD